MYTPDEWAEYEALKRKYKTNFKEMTLDETIRFFSFQYRNSDIFLREATQTDIDNFIEKAGGGLAMRMQSPYLWWGINLDTDFDWHPSNYNKD